MAAVASLAGADPSVAVRAAMAMVAMQVSIGALNDVMDVERDAGRKLAKPIPAGLVSRRAGMVVVIVAGGLGLGLSATLGAPVLAVAALGLGIGYAYDLWARGTAWSWLPLTLALPLLPVYAWLAATRTIPPWFIALVPMAALAGMALSIANSAADVERDREAGIGSIAADLGPRGAFAVIAGLWLGSALIAWGSLAGLASVVPWGLVIGGAVAVAIGAARVGMRGSPAVRERAWEAQAVAAAVAGVAWLVGMEVLG